MATIDDQVESILGLFVLSFGRGVGNLHVKREVVPEIRQSFMKDLRRCVADTHWNWKAEAATLLGFMEAIGRLSAHLTLSAGRTVIEASEVRKAIDAVVAEHVTKGEVCMGAAERLSVNRR